MSTPPTAEPPIAGHCDARFAGVREAFRENFAREGELGGAVCTALDGRVVVDLWGGWIDAPGRRPWARDTLVNAYSSGKGPLAMLALAAVETGELDLDAPVARRWPELAAAGAPALTLRALLAHRAGLPAVAAPLANDVLYDWPRMCAALAAQEPWWEPGTDHGYHANTLGFLVGELLRRATGRPVGALVRERLAGPAGADFHWGVPPAEQARIATLVLPFETPPTRMPPGESGDPARDAMRSAAYFNPPGLSGFGTVNTPAWRAAAIPSTNAHATARALARLYDAFLRGAAGVGPALRAEAVRVHAEGTDRVLERHSRFGLGFQLPHARRAFGPSPRAFGHFGYGGALGMADPDARLAFGYVTNRPGERFRTPRTDRLLAAVYAALGAAEGAEAAT